MDKLGLVRSVFRVALVIRGETLEVSVVAGFVCECVGVGFFEFAFLELSCFRVFFFF